MLTLVGFVYLYICLSHDHNRGFTQLWLMVMMLGYGTEQILFPDCFHPYFYGNHRQYPQRMGQEIPLCVKNHPLFSTLRQNRAHT